MRTRGATAARGYTIVELSIVLVVAGLLLAGLLKGQEIVNNAKVRSIADQQNSFRIAWYAFVDRFDALPGDFTEADDFLFAAPGDGNSVITENESPLAFAHLTSAGFLRCPQCTITTADATVLPSDQNSPVNIYGGVMAVLHWGNYMAYSTESFGSSPRLGLQSGRRLPSNIIAEVDRKIDDGVPNTGDFVMSWYEPNFDLTNSTIVNCATTDREGTDFVKAPLSNHYNQALFWRPASAEPAIFSNCGAHMFI